MVSRNVGVLSSTHKNSMGKVMYKPILKNEVRVFKQPMTKLFDEKRVFVAGYGSLLFSDGWTNRGYMMQKIKPEDMIECKIDNFERGKFGVYFNQNFYGVIRTKGKYINAALVEILTLKDWIELMATECIAGIFPNYNYRVVDVTDCVTDVELPENAVVHMVVNEPRNRVLIKNSIDAPGYYKYVYNGVLKERSNMFFEEFMKTGGVLP